MADDTLSEHVMQQSMGKCCMLTPCFLNINLPDKTFYIYVLTLEINSKMPHISSRIAQDEPKWCPCSVKCDSSVSLISIVTIFLVMHEADAARWCVLNAEQLDVGGTWDGWLWTWWSRGLHFSTHLSMRNECCNVEVGFWMQSEPTSWINDFFWTWEACSTFTVEASHVGKLILSILVTLNKQSPPNNNWFYSLPIFLYLIF